jgi:hypothetical protein
VTMLFQCGLPVLLRCTHAAAHSRALLLHTFFAAGCPTTHWSSAATISLGVGMSLMPQFMVAEVPLKFWPPY